jgi:4-alpha-glucanotransferase
MEELKALQSLATELGVQTSYIDGLLKPVTVGVETLVRVCAALGAPVTGVHDAVEALAAHHARQDRGALPPVLVAWNGNLSSLSIPNDESVRVELRLENGETAPLGTRSLPLGYHHLTVEAANRHQTCSVISAPVEAWHRPGESHRSWGVGTELAALRSARSRSVGDLRDLETLCRWVRGHGGDLVTVLPLLPTFNVAPPEPSPYSPVSRLFWSELMLDVGDGARMPAPPQRLDVMAADAEVRAALSAVPLPDPSAVGEELARYAQFRGAQIRLGRNWRDWPREARAGTPTRDQVDPGEERFHIVAQHLARQQLHDLRARLDEGGMRLGLDLAVGVHPDGYDPWSRQTLFGEGMSVGAPPDLGFPSGQDWGFAPVLPAASRREGHRYIAASIAHQASLSGVLRVDHIMAWTRLYWIPKGLSLHQGTYVSYPAEELFAILTLESHRNRCEVVGENLGTVPPDIGEALPRHRIWGMYLAEFQEWAGPEDAPLPPTAGDMALVGTHDTPTFAGWLAGNDIADRVEHHLLTEAAAPGVRKERSRAAAGLAQWLARPLDDPGALLAALLEWLGRSESPLVVPWLEDLWLEDRGVNLPGTRSSARPNWQRPMRKLLDDVFTDAEIDGLIRHLARARTSA